MRGARIPLVDAAPSAPVTTIPVQMLSGMDFEDFPNQTSLAVRKTIAVKGLLFNTPGTPTQVTRILRGHPGRLRGRCTVLIYPGAGFPHSWEACCTCAAGPELRARQDLNARNNKRPACRGAQARKKSASICETRSGSSCWSQCVALAKVKSSALVQ